MYTRSICSLLTCLSLSLCVASPAMAEDPGTAPTQVGAEGNAPGVGGVEQYIGGSHLQVDGAMEWILTSPGARPDESAEGGPSCHTPAICDIAADLVAEAQGDVQLTAEQAFDLEDAMIDALDALGDSVADLVATQNPNADPDSSRKCSTIGGRLSITEKPRENGYVRICLRFGLLLPGPHPIPNLFKVYHSFSSQ